MHDSGDWDDRELDGDEPSTDVILPLSEGGFRSWIPWLLWSLIPLGLLGLWLTLSGGEDPAPAPVLSSEVEAAEPADLPPAPPEAEPEETEPAIELPPLAESDPVFREMAAPLSKESFLASLLGADDLVRKLVVIVANVAEGTSPKRQLLHVRPEERFSVIETSERVVLDERSYRRYDPAAAFFASLDAQLVAKLYRVFDPLLEEAHGELGLSDRRDFDDTLTRAIDVLLATPAVDGPVRLRAVNVNYAFDDPRLERLSPAQKHLVRMGPQSTRRIQAKLRELAAALGLSPKLSEAKALP